MKRILIGSALGGIALFASSAWATSDNLIVCAQDSFVRQECAVRGDALGQPVVEAGQSFATDFVVTYEFPCTGHHVEIELAANGPGEPLSQGVARATVTVTGDGELHVVDPDPGRTSELTFRRGCRLNVTNVTRFPAVRTIQDWTGEAQSEARILELSVSLYLLAKDYEAIASWNTGKLEMMKDKLEKLRLAEPSNLEYRVMLNCVVSALAHEPASSTLDELRHAGEEVTASLRRELLAEVTKGRAIVDRFTRWQLQAEATLTEVLTNIPN